MGFRRFIQNKKLDHGEIGAFSFDFAKTTTTGGGMLCLKTNTFKKLALGMITVTKTIKGSEMEDTRSDSGFNFRMNEMQGAVGIAQLKKINFIIKQRMNYLKLKRN